MMYIINKGLKLDTQKSHILCTKEIESENLKHTQVLYDVHCPPFLNNFFLIIQNLLFATIQCLRCNFILGGLSGGGMGSGVVGLLQVSMDAE